MDYTTLSMDMVFSAGSANGAMQCVAIDIDDTDPLEDPETFTVTLATASSVILTHHRHHYYREQWYGIKI